MFRWPSQLRDRDAKEVRSAPNTCFWSAVVGDQCLNHPVLSKSLSQFLSLSYFPASRPHSRTHVGTVSAPYFATSVESEEETAALSSMAFSHDTLQQKDIGKWIKGKGENYNGRARQRSRNARVTNKGKGKGGGGWGDMVWDKGGKKINTHTWPLSSKIRKDRAKDKGQIHIGGGRRQSKDKL